MSFDHTDPQIRHALEHARVLRAQYLRQLFWRKNNDPKKPSEPLFKVTNATHIAPLPEILTVKEAVFPRLGAT